ncbi:MAG TPA: class I SAM-dependent methyltransferase [Dehalococcoidia bacterium]|jgi:ubiquinone/menaquinone biosynthesis C-methylase UbiE
MCPSHEPVQARITGFWSTVAPEYEAHMGNVPSPASAEYDAWVEAVRELLPPAPADVLDIATGTGFAALIAAGLGHRVTAIDLSWPMLAQARKEAQRRGLSVTFATGDAVEPDFPAASFDAITNRHFIWTLREPVRAFRNWLRLLRPGGRVVSIDGFWFAQAGDGAATDEGPNLFDQHYTPETRAALPAMQLTTVEPIVGLFEAAGFASVTIGDLAAVHAVAANPPSPQPWYVVVAHRP